MQPEIAKRAETIAKVTPQPKIEADTETPKGTLAIVLIFAVVMVVLWGYIYVQMLLRG